MQPQLTPQQAAVTAAHHQLGPWGGLALALSLGLASGGGLGSAISDRETAAELRVLSAKVDDSNRRIAGLESKIDDQARRLATIEVGSWTRADHDRFAQALEVTIERRIGKLEDENARLREAVQRLSAGGK